MNIRKIFALLILVTLIACGGEDGDGDVDHDSFDRSAMLANWADNIIIPAYSNYSEAIDELNDIGVTLFVESPSTTSLATLRSLWKEAYLAWQEVEMFEIGMAETIGLQGYTNSFPLDEEELESIIAAGVYNLELPSRRNQQGLPALDYLINGLADTDEEIVAIYLDEETGSNYLTFMQQATERLVSLTETVVSEWENGYRGTFVGNDGSSGTASVDKMANDFVYYYEKYLRAAKVGIPAGVFSGTASGYKAEAVYQNDFSKELFLTGLNAAQRFFNGTSFDGMIEGESLSSYLTYLEAESNGEDLAALINDQFDASKSLANDLSDSFAEQVESNNNMMLTTYDALQENVILLKVDMFQVLNVRVDYVDADGD